MEGALEAILAMEPGTRSCYLTWLVESGRVRPQHSPGHIVHDT